MSRAVKLVWAFIGILGIGGGVFLSMWGIPAPQKTQTITIAADDFLKNTVPHVVRK